MPLRHSDIWAAAARHSGHMGSSSVICPTCRRSYAPSPGAENSIEKSWQQLEGARKHPGAPSKWSTRWRWQPARSRSHPIPRHPVARHVRHLRGHRGTVDKLDSVRPCRRDRTQADNLRRLKALLSTAARTIDSCCSTVPAALSERAWHLTSKEFPDSHTVSITGGRELALSCRGTVRLI